MGSQSLWIWDYYVDAQNISIPVHPEATSLLRSHQHWPMGDVTAGPTLEVVPLANTRTVLVLSQDGAAVKPHFVKLHFPFQLSRFSRGLYRPEICHSLQCSETLSRAGLKVLRDLGGCALRNARGSWGFLVRDPRDVSIDDVEPKATFPFFALYGRNVRNASAEPLLIELIRTSGVAPFEYVCLNLIRPALEMWIQAARRTGLLLSMHAQNTLVSLFKNSVELCYRGCNVYVDEALATNDVETYANYDARVIAVLDEQKSLAVRSLTFDSFLGHHMLEYVARLMSARYSISARSIHCFAQESFAELSEGAIEMPPSIHYYAPEAANSGYGPGFWPLVDTGIKPRWRP
jgi:hypothetical protein